MQLEFIEFDLDWPYELSIFELRRNVLAKLIEYGDPLRWAITSVTHHSEKKVQIISIEVVVIIDKNKQKGLNPECS